MQRRVRWAMHHWRKVIELHSHTENIIRRIGAFWSGSIRRVIFSRWVEYVLICTQERYDDHCVRQAQVGTCT